MSTETKLVEPWIATAGEALIDMVAQEDGSFVPCLGGAAYNLTRALALQGVPTIYLNPLSGDRFGQQLAAELQAAGVVRPLKKEVREVTSLALVSINECGHPDYAFYREGVADRAVTAEELNSVCGDFETLQVVCTGALALAVDDVHVYTPWLVLQREAGRMVVIDANLRPSVMRDLEAYRENVLRVLYLAHIIKVSDEDLRNLRIPGDNPDVQAVTLLRQTQASVLVLTCGGDGAHLHTRYGERFSYRDPRPIKVVDTVGAGDCFLAGFLAAWRKLKLTPHWGLEEVDSSQAHVLLSHATTSASLNVQRRGCQPPTENEVTQWCNGV